VQALIDRIVARSALRGRLEFLGVVAWLAAFAGWTAYLGRHQWTPGQASAAAVAWPAESRLARETGKFTLVAFAHPLCPCWRATLAELRAIESRYSDRLQVVVVLGAPAERDPENMAALSEHIREAMPRSASYFDLDRHESRCFGARTSGDVLLYLPNGEHAFHGGITAGRGHAGPNQGAQGVVSILEGKRGEQAAPVFGCPLGHVAGVR
jgi:hypothetical protein